MGSLREAAARAGKAKTAKLARATVTLPLPLFGGLFVARFGVLDSERLEELEELTLRDDITPEETLQASAQFVADACRTLMSREAFGKTPEKMSHDDGRPVRFDQELAQELGLRLPDGREPESMADVVLACWTVEDPDDPDERAISQVALNGFGNKLLVWMQNTSKAVEDELLGGSAGGPQ